MGRPDRVRRLLALVVVLAASACKDSAPPEQQVKPAQPTPATALDAATPDAAARDAASLDAEQAALGRLVVEGSLGVTFAPAPGVVYASIDNHLVSVPKAGGPPIRLEGVGITSMQADAGGVVFCDDKQLKHVRAGSTKAELIHETSDWCAVLALDGSKIYYTVIGDHERRLERITRDGGKPETLWRDRSGMNIALDGDTLWLARYAGTIWREHGAPKQTGRHEVFADGQKKLEDLAVTSDHVYWFVEYPNEIRRRPKAGGAIQVLSTTPIGQTVEAVDGHVYWIDRDPDATGAYRLRHLAPGAAEAETIVSDLGPARLRADADGVYVQESDARIYMYPR